MNAETLFCDYFSEWVDVYKKGVVSTTTLVKYQGTLKHIRMICPDLRIKDITKREYQKILNVYAENHATQTVKDFHAQIKACVMDAIDEGIITINPARKVEFKGNQQKKTPPKYLSVEESKRLASGFDLSMPLHEKGVSHVSLSERKRRISTPVNWDLLFLICLKTGLRFAEALGLTTESFDFENQTLTVNGTFDYKHTNTLTDKTKTKTSKRKIAIDDSLCKIIKNKTMDITSGVSIFVPLGERVFSSTAISRLRTLCKLADVPPIGVHGLRHTHASILFSNGVSLNSISKRLGHAKPSITQDTYLHIINELQQIDEEKILTAMDYITES